MMPLNEMLKDIEYISDISYDSGWVSNDQIELEANLICSEDEFMDYCKKNKSYIFVTGQMMRADIRVGIFAVRLNAGFEKMDYDTVNDINLKHINHQKT